jgi:hypothetical protein
MLRAGRQRPGVQFGRSLNLGLAIAVMHHALRTVRRSGSPRAGTVLAVTARPPRPRELSGLNPRLPRPFRDWHGGLYRSDIRGENVASGAGSLGGGEAWQVPEIAG